MRGLWIAIALVFAVAGGAILGNMPRYSGSAGAAPSGDRVSVN
jgi:hypothetical protein